MKALPGAVAIFVAVLAVGTLGARIAHPGRSLGSMLEGDDADAADSRVIDLPEADPASGCLAVPRRMLDHLEQALTGEGKSLRLARAYRHGNFERPFYVAAEIDGPGMEGDGEIGTWSANALTLTDGTVVKAEEDVAAANSAFPDGRTTDGYDRGMFESGLALAGDCVRAEEAGS
jgi:hypothetical protein